jgi:hypothetical protein
MGAVFATFSADAGFHTKKIRVCAMDAFSERNTHFRNGEVASMADCKKVFADDKVFAVLSMVVCFNRTADPAAHENMGMNSSVFLYLSEVFIYPMDAGFTAEHGHP